MPRPGRKPGIKNGSRTDEAFEFIKAEIARTGLFPTHKAIREHMGWNSNASAADVVSRLIGQRRLLREEGFNAAGKRWVKIYVVENEMA